MLKGEAGWDRAKAWAAVVRRGRGPQRTSPVLVTGSEGEVGYRHLVLTVQNRSSQSNVCDCRAPVCGAASR
jgi:hypothetical protein